MKSKIPVIIKNAPASFVRVKLAKGLNITRTPTIATKIPVASVINQESSLGNVWPFDVIEDALDKITMIMQDLNEKQKRSIQIPESADPDSTWPTTS